MRKDIQYIIINISLSLSHTHTHAGKLKIDVSMMTIILNIETSRGVKGASEEKIVISHMPHMLNDELYLNHLFIHPSPGLHDISIVLHIALALALSELIFFYGFSSSSLFLFIVRCEFLFFSEKCCFE
jgi:hypothetical protein